MSTVKSKYSPLHITCQIGQPFGNPSSSYVTGYHTGTDFPASLTSESNPDIYAVCDDGEVVYVYKDATGNGGSQALGNQVQIIDNKTGYYYRFCHLLYGSIEVSVGDKVNTGTKLAKMGNTGNSTGTHLHLECTTEQSWSSHTFIDPVAPLGIPNERGTIVEYDGSSEPQPPNPPEPPIETHKYKTVINFRKRINIF